jgi:type III secretion protein R
MKGRVAVVAGAGVALVPAWAHAAAGGDGIASRPLVLLLVMAALSLVPFILLMTTCFVKVAVVLSILRGAIGAPQVPPTQIVTGLALILTLYVMAPTGERMYRAVKPVLGAAAGAEVVSGKTVEGLAVAAERAKEPMREFLVKHADRRDRATFHSLALRMRTAEERAGITDADLMVLVPAFVTSELRRAFEIGFLLFLPFLVLDLVISNVLLALGMHMLSPTTVSLPFKLLLFVLADGWHLVARGLVESYL